MSSLPDVDDDADRPHVERAVVALVLEHFRCEVGGRADDGASERLVADDAREAEVAQPDLRMRTQTLSRTSTCSHVRASYRNNAHLAIRWFVKRIIINLLNDNRPSIVSSNNLLTAVNYEFTCTNSDVTLLGRRYLWERTLGGQ